MDIQTPGVYVRELDGGARPIAAVPSSVAGIYGAFHVECVAGIQWEGSGLIGRLDVDERNGCLEPVELLRAATQLESAGLTLRDPGALARGWPRASWGRHGDGWRLAIGRNHADIGPDKVDVDGRPLGLTGADFAQAVRTTLGPAAEVPVDTGALLAAYGARRRVAPQGFSLPAEAVFNKAEAHRFLGRWFAGWRVAEGDQVTAGDLERPGPVRRAMTAWMSRHDVFRFVAAVDGFFDNGGNKAWLVLEARPSASGSIREEASDGGGLYALDGCEDVAMLLAPGLPEENQREVLEHCEVRKDRFAILDGPVVSTGEVAAPSSDRGFGAMYVPWVKTQRPAWFEGSSAPAIPDEHRRRFVPPQNHEVVVPPSGHVAGVFARVDAGRGVHKAPANETILGITGLSQSIHAGEQGRYNDRGVNVLRAFEGRGIRVWGARTLGTLSGPAWKYVNVRRLFIQVERSIQAGLTWAVFEPNDALLWSRIERDVRAYLLRVWSGGALFGKTAEEAFFVRCDAESNPRWAIDAGQVNVVVGIAPVKPAEFVIFTIGQWDGGSDVNE